MFVHSCFGSVSAAAGVKKEIKKYLRKSPSVGMGQDPGTLLFILKSLGLKMGL